MSTLNDTTVLIGGNVYTLSGAESPEYIQRVALYINTKLEEIKKSDNAKNLNTRLMAVLLDINIADDYFKEKTRTENLEKTIHSTNQKIEDLELELARLRAKLDESVYEKSIYNQKIDALKNEVESYKTELDEYIEIFDNERHD